jgi:hypothetical protein
MGESHRCAEAESVALASLEWERDETAGVERHRGRGERRFKAAEMDERVSGDDETTNRRGFPHQRAVASPISWAS